MDLNKKAEDIWNIYQQMDINHCYILYETGLETIAQALSDILIKHDFPVFFMTMYHHIVKWETLSMIERNYRLFIMPIDIFNKILELRNYDILNVSVIFGLGTKSTEATKLLIQKHNPIRQTTLQLFTV
jgi:hypothetical protein